MINVECGFRALVYHGSGQELGAMRKWSLHGLMEHLNDEALRGMDDDHSPCTRFARWSTMHNSYLGIALPQLHPLQS